MEKRPEDTSDIAAVMLETVQGEGGVNPADPEFIEALQTFCKDKHPYTLTFATLPWMPVGAD